MKSILVILVLMFTSVVSAAVTTKTCSGRMRYCDKYGICTQEHYYLYVNQNYSSSQGLKYKFKMRSILGNKGDYKPRNAPVDNHIIYDGPVFSLAIPIEGHLPLFYFQPHFGVNQWQELCQ